MTLPSVRMTYFLGLLFTSLVLGIPIYLQIHNNIQPCALCILQRIAFGCVGIIFFFGTICSVSKWRQIFLGLCACVFSLIGVFLAGRQVWLQHLPASESVDCGASLEYMLQVLPWTQVLQKVIMGGSECSVVDGRFLNLSLAEWSLICFIFLLSVSIWQLLRKK